MRTKQAKNNSTIAQCDEQIKKLRAYLASRKSKTEFNVRDKLPELLTSSPLSENLGLFTSSELTSAAGAGLGALAGLPFGCPGIGAIIGGASAFTGG